MSNPIPSLLDALGVGRPLPNGLPWSRELFAADVGINPADMTPSRTDTARQERLALACVWALAVLDGRVPEGAQVATSVWTLTCRIVSAWTQRQRLREDLDGLAGWLVCWRIDADGVALAAELLEDHGERLEAAHGAQGWAGVLVVLREVLA